MDIWEKEKRSDVMSKIRASRTKPENAIASALFKRGIRFRRNVKDLPGKPDLVFPKYRTVLFVHGCFWHQHKNCRDGAQPKSRRDYWIPKLERNIQRDKQSKSRLNRLGWRVVTIWECQIERDIGRVTKIVENRLEKNLDTGK